jgi:hypothetical protein
MNKKALLFIISLILLFVAPSTVSATMPQLEGVVLVQGTNAPVAGVWVKMQTSGYNGSDASTCAHSPAARYEMTDFFGRFVFDPVYPDQSHQPTGICDDPRFGKQIDTDIDGINDTVQMPLAPPSCAVGWGGDPENFACTSDFGCITSPMSFSVEKPFDMVGSFTSVSDVSFSNLMSTIDVGSIYYIPQTTNVTPIPTSSSQSFIHEPSFPNCSTPTVLQFGGGNTDLCRVDYGSCKMSNTYTFNASGGNGTVKIYSGVGHRWDEDCNIGPNNDPSKSRSLGLGNCDHESQTHEALKVLLNGTEIGQTTDLGTDINSYWEFPATFVTGQNTLLLRHAIAGQSISVEAESVFYKGIICDSSISAIPTPTPNPSYANSPEYPACTGTTVKYFGIDSFCDRDIYPECHEKTYPFNISSAQTGSVIVQTNMGHSWDRGCNLGPGNDIGGDSFCDDESQTNEAVIALVNGVEIGRTEDLGTDVTGEWTFPASFVAGSNNLTLRMLRAGTAVTTSEDSESVDAQGTVCTGTVGSVSCSLNLSPQYDLTVSNTSLILPNITQANGTVDSVAFTLSSSANASVCDSSLSSCPAGNAIYTDTVTGFGANISAFVNGTATLSVSGQMIDEGVTCTPDTATISITGVDSWWQVKEGDVMTNGDIVSEIPISCTPATCDPSFIIHDSGGDPGVPIAGGTFGGPSVSSTGWIAEGSGITLSTIYNFDFFERRTRDIHQVNINVPTIDQTDLTGGVSEDGYEYFFYDGALGDLTINGNVNVGNRRIVLIAKDASVRVEGTILVTDGSGFFMLVAENDITIASSVGGVGGGLPHIEGLYFAGLSFVSEGNGSGDIPLRIRGAVSSDIVSLERDLTDNSDTPAESFEYAADQYLLYPARLSQPWILWKEIGS